MEKTFASERIRKDLDSLVPSLPFWIKFIKRDELEVIFEYRPTCGPYFGKICELAMRFPVGFPFQSPKLELVGDIRNSHPFVDPKTGAVCMDVLRLGWMPSTGIDTLVYGFALMLEDPLSLYEEGSEVLNETALQELKNKRV